MPLKYTTTKNLGKLMKLNIIQPIAILGVILFCNDISEEFLITWKNSAFLQS